MLIENNPGAAETPAPRHPPSRNDSQRWLAELEREFLQATEPPPSERDGARASAPPPPSGKTGPTHKPAHSGAGAGFDATGADRTGPRPVLANGAVASNPDMDAAADATATATPAAAIPATRPAAGIAPRSSGQAPTETPPPPIALSPAIAAAHALGPRGHGGDPGSAATRAPAPRYARQLMSLTEGEHASATIRDASLAPAESQKVAHSVSLQLQAAGLSVQRIFINGQRFDGTPTGVAPRAGRLQPLIQDDDA